MVSPSPLVEREIMDVDAVEPTDPIDPVVTDPVPRDIAVMGQKRRPASARQTLQDAEGHAIPRPFWESKRPQRYACYVALMGSLLDSEPATFDTDVRTLIYDV